MSALHPMITSGVQFSNHYSLPRNCSSSSVAVINPLERLRRDEVSAKNVNMEFDPLFLTAELGRTTCSSASDAGSALQPPS